MLKLPMLTILAVALLVHGGAAYGASTSATGDPPTGSPAGAVYELPLERGRAEAAPKGSGGTVAGPGGEDGPGGENGGPATQTGDADAVGEAPGGERDEGGEEGSLYRSENNFGSSSHVPGTPSGADGEAASAGESGAEAAANLAQGRETAQVADSGNTSPATNIALLGAVALIALGSGVLVRRGRLRAEQ